MDSTNQSLGFILEGVQPHHHRGVQILYESFSWLNKRYSCRWLVGSNSIQSILNMVCLLMTLSVVSQVSLLFFFIIYYFSFNYCYSLEFYNSNWAGNNHVTLLNGWVASKRYYHVPVLTLQHKPLGCHNSCWMWKCLSSTPTNLKRQNKRAACNGITPATEKGCVDALTYSIRPSSSSSSSHTT